MMGVEILVGTGKCGSRFSSRVLVMPVTCGRRYFLGLCAAVPALEAELDCNPSSGPPTTPWVPEIS